MLIPAWISFLITLALLMWLAQKDLGVALLVGAILFGILTEVSLWGAFLSVVSNPSYVFLAIAVALIPLIGGVMEESGMMTEMIDRMDIPKRAAMMLSPALFGLLPMPGGALLSAPIVDKVDPELDQNRKVAINVWHRHLLILVYPASSALIIATYLAGIPLYTAFVALLIPFALMFVVGYFTLVRFVEKKTEVEKQESTRDLRVVFRNLFPILLAPIFDLVGRNILRMDTPEIMLCIGMTLSLVFALRISKVPANHLGPIAKKMKIWRYPLIVVSMFFFLEVFNQSGVPEFIGSLNLHFIVLLLIGLFLGFASGRVQLPITILIPIFLAQHGLLTMGLLEFVMLYFAVFLGYLYTPVHPCVAYTIEYFKDADYRHSFKYLAIPTFICFGILLGVAGILAVVT